MTGRELTETPAESVSRRKLLAGGITAAAAAAGAAIASSSSAQETGPTDAADPSTYAIPAVLRRHITPSDVIDVSPLGQDRLVRVELELDTQRTAADFSEGDSIGVVLAPGAGMVDISEWGKSGPVRSEGIITVVMGKRSDKNPGHR